MYIYTYTASITLKIVFTKTQLNLYLILLCSSVNVNILSFADKKWKKMTLADLARVFGLRNMEKESYLLNVVGPHLVNNMDYTIMYIA